MGYLIAQVGQQKIWATNFMGLFFNFKNAYSNFLN
jgi:hypothetical protein